MRWKNEIKDRLSRSEYKWNRGPFTYYVRKNTTTNHKQTYLVMSDSTSQLSKKATKIVKKYQKKTEKKTEKKIEKKIEKET